MIVRKDFMRLGGALLLGSLSAVALAESASSNGPTPPFIGGPLTVFDVETAVIDSGALMDAKVYVSAHDRKYVTYGGNNLSTANLGLQDVQTSRATVQVGKFGYVGGIMPAGTKTATTGPWIGPPMKAAQAQKPDSVFNQRGVFLLTPLK